MDTRRRGRRTPDRSRRQVSPSERRHRRNRSRRALRGRLVRTRSSRVRGRLPRLWLSSFASVHWTGSRDEFSFLVVPITFENGVAEESTLGFLVHARPQLVENVPLPSPRLGVVGTPGNRLDLDL